MNSRRLASSRTADLIPLGTSGQRAFEVIRREASALGPDYEALFAEPFLSPEGDTIDWYATQSGSPVALLAADEASQAAGRVRLDALIAGLMAKADALSVDADPERQRLGEALRNAIEVPDEGSVYLVGGQPVLINWAHRANTAHAPVGVLTARLAAPAPPAAPPPPVVASAPPAAAEVAPPPPVARGPSSFSWLWWALWGAVGGLAAAVAWVLVPACGISSVSWLNWCPEPAFVASPESDRAPELRAELDLLERDLLDRDAQCRGPALACTTPPTETALLLDLSTSMEFGVKTPAEIEAELAQIVDRFNARGDGEFATPEDARRYTDLINRARSAEMGEARMKALREALGSAFESTEPLRVRVAPFATCNELELSGPITDAATARALIDGLEMKKYTALAYAIGRAAATLEGGRTADDPANMLVISDGYDTCGGDPCAAARAAKAARPGLTIDVVDLVGLPELRCVAQETGGRYILSAGGIEPALIARLLSDAAARGREEICRPESFESILPQSPPAEQRADNADGEFDRRVEEAGGGDGALKVTLIWDTLSDLDLAVTCPSGEVIKHDRKQACGGELDIDRNANNPIERPVENVVFSGDVPQGSYRITVTNYAQRGAAANPFKVRVQSGGDANVHEGMLNRTGETATFNLTIP